MAKNNSRPVFVTQYSSSAFEMKQIIKSNWGLIQSDPILRDVFPETPMTVFKKAPSIRDKLVRSYLPGSKKKHGYKKVCWEPIGVGLAVIVKV